MANTFVFVIFNQLTGLVIVGSEALETVKVFALAPLFSKEGLGEI